VLVLTNNSTLTPMIKACREELEGFVGEGVISKLYVAFSRKDQSKKTYVQHLMQENSADIWGQLHLQKASIFVCGDARNMAKDVANTLVGIVEAFGCRTRELAEQYVSSLRETQRYVEDVWG